MEDTLRDDINYNKVLDYILCLNPCSNGRYSQRLLATQYIAVLIVLILVLMEDTLRV